MSAQDAFGLGFPGFRHGLDAAPGPGQNYDAIRSPRPRATTFIFRTATPPSPGCSCAASFQRRFPDSTADDIVTARADYAKLDVDGSPVRIRLSSPVMRVRAHRVTAQTGRGRGTYSAGRRLSRSVTADHVVLACWHTVIPLHLSRAARGAEEALAFAIKVPLVYTNVFVRSWTVFQKLGVQQRLDAGPVAHSSCGLDSPVSVGDLPAQKNPAEPIVLHMSKSACQPGLPVRDQHRAGRAGVARDLVRARSSGAFATSWPACSAPADSIRRADILGITVNRWPHGYAYSTTRSSTTSG